MNRLLYGDPDPKAYDGPQDMQEEITTYSEIRGDKLKRGELDSSL